MSHLGRVNDFVYLTQQKPESSIECLDLEKDLAVVFAKRVVWFAKSEAEKEFADVKPNSSSDFRIAKQMNCTNQDVVGEPWVHNDADLLTLTDEEKMALWVKHYSQLLNIEFEWPSNELLEVTAREPSQCVSGADPQGSQQNEVWQGCQPIRHYY